MTTPAVHSLGSPIVGVAITNAEEGAFYDREAVSGLLTDLLCQGLEQNACRDNPLGSLVRPGDRVTVKPNLVSHHNQSGAGLSSLVTNATVVEATIELLAKAKAGKIIVGDAPIQGCDLPQLLETAGYNAVAVRCRERGIDVEWRDFRRSILTNADGVWDRNAAARPIEDYVLYDLGGESLLEPISKDSKKFRVTMYNPDLMRQTHAPGLHQYLVAREVIDTDVVINLPKLKTHKKAGVTGALKNLVGINGNKDYLPHHRLGGSKLGGDCYEGRNYFKLLAEWLVDASNRREGRPAYWFREASRMSYMAARLMGSDRNLEGSWHGNDTVWRMSLDLNRVLLYGRSDGTLADVPQRRIVSITDALICGEGEGPLAPTPHPLGALTLATNSAAAELVHAHLMGFDWRKIHIIREAFGGFSHPICDFTAPDVQVRLGGQLHAQPWPVWHNRRFAPPTGWKGHCEQ